MWLFGLSNFKESEKNFISNGCLLQEELMALCNGKSLPIHVFSAKQVSKMSNFTQNELIREDVHFRVYRGFIKEENRAICIKKFHEVYTYVGMKGIVREIVLATQMSKHNNALKLLGCCLETDIPSIVLEFAEQGCLVDRLSRQARSHGVDVLSWMSRLRIGCEIAYALAYLQNGFSRVVVFRNLSANDVFLDKDCVAKLTGFDFSVLIPEGEVHTDDAVVGTIGYGAPEYVSSGRLTEKTDVYQFGVLLLELLRSRHEGSPSIHFLLSETRNDTEGVQIGMIIDPAIQKEVEENSQEQQLQEVCDLIRRCTAYENDRPSIAEVARELKKIFEHCELSQDTP